MRKSYKKNFDDHVNYLKNNTKNDQKINEQIIGGIKKKAKRCKEKNFNFMKEIIQVIEKNYPRTSRNIKYSYEDVLSSLILFTTTQVSWRRFQGKVPGKYLNTLHLQFARKGIYKKINSHLLELYLEKDRSLKLKYQSIDSSFIANKRGLSNTTSKFITNNRYNGRKKYLKISHLVDSKGVVLGSHIIPGNCSDCKSVDSTINNINVNINTLKCSNNNKHKQYLLADSGYDTKEIHKSLIDKGYTPIIKPNKRNTKDENKKRKLTVKQEKIYKKRQVVESSFAWTKSYAVINQNYEKTVESYNGLLILANSIILSKKINNERTG